MTSLYDMIYSIDNDFEGIYFDKIVGVRTMGDIRSGADKYPIQYTAYSTIIQGDDDPFEGVGWTPSEAVRNLLINIKEEK